MRAMLWTFAATASLALVGCAGHPTDPVSATAGQQAEGGLGHQVTRDGLTTGALGIYTVRIDPGSLTATSELKAARAGQATDDLYLLPIDGFLKPDSFTVRRIEATPTQLLLTYDVKHPFPAPADLDAPPNGSTNRADLGITAIALVLADVTSPTGNTYFGTSVANTALVANADAYYNPAGLLNTGTTANTFPYKLVVDEVLGPEGNRLLINNGGNPAGDYGDDGWTRAEMGLYNDDWAGYGVLHQGQTARNTVALNRDALAGGPVEFDVALIAKYNDPRGGATGAEKKANRLPPATPDYTRFAYRMPHGALDVQKITFRGASDPYVVGSLSASTLSFHVEDWDARSAETTLPDLSQDPVLTKVAVGEGGAPSVEVSIPGVVGDTTTAVAFVNPPADDDSTAGGDAGTDSGFPGDALYYSEPVNSQASGPAAPAPYTGMVRVTDPEVNIPDPAFIVELDGSLTPLSSNIPLPVTYQVFTVEAEVPVVGSGWAVRFGGTGSDEAQSIVQDSQGNFIVGGYFRNTVNFGGGDRVASGSLDAFLMKLDPNGSYIWDRTFGGANNSVIDQVSAVAVDSANNIYAVGYFNGTTDLGGGPRVSPGFQSYFVAKYDTTGTHVWDKAYGAGGSPSTSNGNGVALDPAGNVIASGFVSGPVDFGGGTISGTGYDITIVKLTASGGYSWARRISSVGTDTLDYGYGVVTNGAGDIFATGMYNGSSIDFGLGSRPNGGSSDAYLIRLNGTTGATIWDRQFSGTGTQQGYDVDLFGGHVFASGFLNNAGNFGGGVRTPASTDGYIVKYTDTGDYVWDKIVGGPNSDWNRALEVDPINGAIYATFDFSTTVNFGGNPRTVNGGRDNALVKWDVDGVYQWDATWGGATTGSEFAYGLTLDSSRNPIVAGGFTGTNVDFNPHPTDTFPMSSQGFTDVFVMRIMGPTGGW